MRYTSPQKSDDDDAIPGPYDGTGEPALWFLPDDDIPAVGVGDLPQSPAPRGGLIAAAEWRGAEAGLAPDLADLAFDAGRLAERVVAFGAGAAQRLALEEAAALSWWTGDRVTADALALWLSYRSGAAVEGGHGLIRTAWAARRLMVRTGAADLAAQLAETLGGEGRARG